MAIWQLHVLGEESFLVGSGRRIPLPDISWMLLGTVLAAPRRSMSRGRLAAELWPDSDEAAARHCLATTLWRIRQRLDCRDSLIDARDDLIALVGDRAIWIDALAFERRAQAALDDPASLDSGRVRAKLRRALALYAGDFLPRRMNDLIAIERERLRALYLDAGYELARACASHAEWRTTLELSRSLCAVEPLREDVQRLLMEAHVGCGNRAQALQHYRDFERLLAAELAVRPMRETRELVERITLRPQPAPELIERGQRATLVEARQQVALTLSLLDHALTQ